MTESYNAHLFGEDDWNPDAVSPIWDELKRTAKTKTPERNLDSLAGINDEDPEDLPNMSDIAGLWGGVSGTGVQKKSSWDVDIIPIISEDWSDD